MKLLKFFIAINVMAVAVVMSKSSLLGTSPIAAIPNVVSESIGSSIGFNTTVFLAILVVIQILVAKPHSIKESLPYIVQLVPGTCFGIFISFYDKLLSPILATQVYLIQLSLLIISVFVLAFGVLMEIQAGTVVMPGEGLPQTIAQASKRPFPQVKLYCDSAMVVIALILSFLFGNPFLGIREGTVIAMIFTGPIISLLQKGLNRYKK